MANTKTFTVILCPLCDYVTGVSPWSSYGVDNARGALVNHLCRKTHALSRKEARTLAKAQNAMDCEFDVDEHRYIRSSAREKAPSVGAVGQR